MSQPHRRDLAPLKTNDRATILAGMALWTIALVVLLIAQPAPDDRWWIWTCVAGIAGGVFGLWYVRRRDRRPPPPLPPAEEPVEPSTATPPLPGREPRHRSESRPEREVAPRRE